MSWFDGRIFSWSWMFSWTGYTKMDIKIVRVDATDNGLFGHLTYDDFQCITLERHDIAIPVGRYKALPYHSPAHGDVLLLQNVPNRTWVEIHGGNKEADSKCCILVGYKRIGDCLAYPAHKALEDLLVKVKGVNDLWVTIV